VRGKQATTRPLFPLDLEHRAEKSNLLNSLASPPNKIDYSAVAKKPEMRPKYLKTMVGPSRRFSNFPTRC